MCLTAPHTSALGLAIPSPFSHPASPVHVVSVTKLPAEPGELKQMC